MLDFVELTESFHGSFAAAEARVKAGTQPSFGGALALTRELGAVPDFLDPANIPAIAWANMLYFLLIYFLYGVCKAAERRGSAPPNLSWVLRVYNATCVALASYVVFGVVRYKIETRGGRFVCNDLSAESLLSRTRFHNVMWWYYAQKYWEMLDTMFFIMRQSWRQVSFLHIYHHSSITLVTGLFLTLDGSGDLYLPALLNSGIHVLMYSHYFLSSFESLKARVWWRPYLTSLQLAQFAVCFAQPLIALYKGPDCGFASWLKILMLVYQTSMMVLFTLFARVRYGKGKHGVASNASGAKAKGE